MHANRSQLTDQLRLRAGQLGFLSIGITPAISPPGATRLDEWLAAGYAGQMSYIADRRQAYDHPDSVLEGARSVAMLTLGYQTAPAKTARAGQGRVSRYAWGEEDYHDLIHAKLKQLIAELTPLASEARWRGVVDTAPLLERDFAALAGLGWIGKHTLLLNRTEGSWFFLAALLTDLELEYDNHRAADHCGTCTACLDVCPTNAFPEPYVLDASRCISYLTIEHRDAIPRELRSDIGEWLFGCDLCQDVCPWNRKVPVSSETRFEPRSDMNPIDLAGLFSLDDQAFRQRFKSTPLWRAKRRGLLRNAAIVLGNRPDQDASAALAVGLQDQESLIRGACAWALGNYPSHVAQPILEERKSFESEEGVREEIESALSKLTD